MPRAAHSFHTRHDFTPALGQAAFSLLAPLPNGLTLDEIRQTALQIGSPLVRRASPHKVLASLIELELVEQAAGSYRLADAGQRFARGVGRTEVGFRAAVHCLYAWQWWWQGAAVPATPSWNYRHVCARLLSAPVAGVTADEVVLQIVADAERFDCERVSFSRSSVAGVAGWLATQSAPLIRSLPGGRLVPASAPPTPTALRLHTAALGPAEDPVPLDEPTLDRLAEGLLPSARWEKKAPWPAKRVTNECYARIATHPVPAARDAGRGNSPVVSLRKHANGRRFGPGT
jgi:hypothetical protein